MYLQDDRDLRPERMKKKLEKAFGFMIRIRLPGGVITPQQWLALDEIAQLYAGDTLRLRIAGTAGVVPVARSAVRRLEVSAGVSRPLSAVERAVGGAIGGAVSWALMNDPDRSGGPSYRTDWRAAGVGAAWGAGIGAVTGFVFPHERWRCVRLRR